MLGPELAKGRPPAGVAAVRGPGATPCRNCAPEFGPKVGIVTVTTVEPAPAAIVVGLNTHWGGGSPLVSEGNPEHTKLTAELKAALPTGAAKNV